MSESLVVPEDVMEALEKSARTPQFANVMSIFIREVGGEEAFGTMLAEAVKHKDTPLGMKMRIMDAMVTKLLRLSQMEGGSDTADINDKDLDREIRKVYFNLRHGRDPIPSD